MNPQMTEPTPMLERQPLPSVETPEMETLAEVGGVSVSVESEPLEREPVPEVLASVESIPDLVEVTIAPTKPSITVFDIPIELDMPIEGANTITLEGLPHMPKAGLFVTGTSDVKPRPPRPAEGLNTAGQLEWELAA